MNKYDVLAVGELNVDLIFTGLGSMPIPGRELIAKEMHLMLGSSTAICAAGLSRLGLSVGFAGKLGNDDNGALVRRDLARLGVKDAGILTDPTIPTGMTLSLTADRDRALVTCLGTIDQLRIEDLNLSILDSARHVHVGSFFLQSGLRPGLVKLFSEAHARGLTTSLDAGWDDTGCWDYGLRDVLKLTDFFFPNESEALAISGCGTVEAAADMLAGWCPTSVLKLGGEGALFCQGSERIRVPAFEGITVIDATGAGDSFNAGFLCAFLRGLPMETCLHFGNACGALAVTRIGGASSCPEIADVSTFLAGHGVVI